MLNFEPTYKFHYLLENLKNIETQINEKLDFDIPVSDENEDYSDITKSLSSLEKDYSNIQNSIQQSNHENFYIVKDCIQEDFEEKLNNYVLLSKLNLVDEIFPFKEWFQIAEPTNYFLSITSLSKFFSKFSNNEELMKNNFSHLINSLHETKNQEFIVHSFPILQNIAEKYLDIQPKDFVYLLLNDNLSFINKVINNKNTEDIETEISSNNKLFWTYAIKKMGTKPETIVEFSKNECFDLIKDKYLNILLNKILEPKSDFLTHLRNVKNKTVSFLSSVKELSENVFLTNEDLYTQLVEKLKKNFPEHQEALHEIIITSRYKMLNLEVIQHSTQTTSSVKKKKI